MTPVEPFRVGDWLVQPSLNRVSRGAETVGLQPRFVDLLVFLAQRPGAVVSKEQILEAVWAREFVSEGTLTHAIAVIRQALGDDVRNPRYIETIPTRGYRLIAPVCPPDAGGDPAAATSRPRGVTRVRERERFGAIALAAAGVVALLAVSYAVVRLSSARRGAAAPDGAARIVVLPFQNLGPADREYLAQGLTDDITTRLAAAHGVGVVSRTTAGLYAGPERSAREIGEELGVGFIVEGTVRWEPDRPDGTELRVNAQLIRAANDTLVWADTYRVKVSRVVDVGGTIAGRVVQELGVPVAGAEQTRLAARQTTDSDAYQAFLCGMRYHDLESRDQLGLAAAMFGRAAGLDPAFALAQAELSLVRSRMFRLAIDRSAACAAEAERAADRALALQPGLPEGHLAVGAVAHFVRGELDRALEEYRLAQPNLPSDSEVSALIADVRRRQGRWGEARTELEGTLSREPGNYPALLALGATLSDMRAFDEADQAFRRAGDLSPDRLEPYVGRFWNFLGWDGTTDRAQRVLEEAPLHDQPAVLYCASYLAYLRRDFRGALGALALAGDGPPGGEAPLPPKPVLECVFLDAAGDRSAAERSCVTARALAASSAAERPADPWPRLGVALADAALGRRGEAAAEASRAVGMRPITADAYDGARCLLGQAEVLARVGDRDAAIAIGRRLLAVPGPLSAGLLRLDPVWDALRAEPAFRAIVEAAPAATR